METLVKLSLSELVKMYIALFSDNEPNSDNFVIEWFKSLKISQKTFDKYGYMFSTVTTDAETALSLEGKILNIDSITFDNWVNYKGEIEVKTFENIPFVVSYNSEYDFYSIGFVFSTKISCDLVISDLKTTVQK